MLKSFGLTGRSDNRVDAKGRIAIPAPMRRILAPEAHDEVVISFGRDGHLALFNKVYWVETIQQNIVDQADSPKGPKDWENIQKAIHRQSENSHMSAVDGQGRITLPQWLLDKAGIATDAVIIGAVDRVTVWAPERYAAWIGTGDDGESPTGIYI